MKWLKGFYFDDNAPDGAVTITDARYEELLQGQSKGLMIEEKNGVPILLGHQMTESERTIAAIRSRRNSECFAVINRGELWYSRLREAQKAELNVWYSGWLDAPQTKAIPNKPQWLEE